MDVRELEKEVVEEALKNNVCSGFVSVAAIALHLVRKQGEVNAGALWLFSSLRSSLVGHEVGSSQFS